MAAIRLIFFTALGTNYFLDPAEREAANAAYDGVALMADGEMATSACFVVEDLSAEGGIRGEDIDMFRGADMADESFVGAEEATEVVVELFSGCVESAWEVAEDEGRLEGLKSLALSLSKAAIAFSRSFSFLLTGILPKNVTSPSPSPISSPADFLRLL